MSEEKTNDVVKKPHHVAIDVFTHSKTGFPGAWTEEETQVLLNTWEDVLSRPRSRRYSVSKRIHRHLSKREDFKDVRKEDIVKQMDTLRAEYTTYLGLQIVGVETVRPDCVDQLERIFSKTPKYLRQGGRRQRRSTEPSRQTDAISEDSDHSRSFSVTYGETEKEQKPEISVTTKNEETSSNTTRRGRFKRMNIQRLIRTMVNQQNAMMDQVQKLFTALEESNLKTASLLEDLVAIQKVKQSNVTERDEIITSMA